MKFWKVWSCLTVVLAFALAGCDKETELGGPGATGGEAADSEKTFSLSLPDGTNVAQGADEEATITLNPGDEFTEEVIVKVEAPAGVTFEPSEVTLSHEKPEAKVMIRAEPTAQAGDHVVKVTGTPATGEAVNSTFSITVDAEDEGTATTNDGDVSTDELTPPADGDAPVDNAPTDNAPADGAPVDEAAPPVDEAAPAPGA